ncbi:hypothetical protein KUTeg_010922 [Tegillarca granosa]|uniref:Uncharacterized protein n=1 Tax=Tegillarca granosa TaxID=220873 RepID=A0ABQ9F5K9_TEGGR|nr:hypothetical protein KUTeg_010922 [Tegillarca granosa]
MIISYEERILTLQDWNHDWDPGVDFLKYVNGIFINRTRMEKVYKQDDDFLVHINLIQDL